MALAKPEAVNPQVLGGSSSKVERKKGGADSFLAIFAVYLTIITPFIHKWMLQ